MPAVYPGVYRGCTYLGCTGWCTYRWYTSLGTMVGIWEGLASFKPLLLLLEGVLASFEPLLSLWEGF